MTDYTNLYEDILNQKMMYVRVLHSFASSQRVGTTVISIKYQRVLPLYVYATALAKSYLMSYDGPLEPNHKPMSYHPCRFANQKSRF